MNPTQLLELQGQIAKLQNDVRDLSAQVNKNSFSGSQTFNKDVTFSSRLRVPVYSAAPSVGEIGDLICVSAKLYVCTTAGDVSTPATFTLVGSQV